MCFSESVSNPQFAIRLARCRQLQQVAGHLGLHGA
jgi:hypothetical protein